MKSASVPTRKLSPRMIAKEAVKRIAQAGVIAEFTGTLTTPDEDRDCDVLLTGGAKPDPAMPLLWAHDAGKPIGKLTEIVSHTDEALVGRFQVADTPLGRDAAALLEIGALRLSIGFQPDEYEPRKKSGGKEEGFVIKSFRVWETSVVGVPSNESAVVLSFQRGDLKTPEALAWAKQYVSNIATEAAFEDQIEAAVQRTMQKMEREEAMKLKKTDRPTADEIIAGAGAQTQPADSVRIRVKDVSESFYSTKRTRVEFTKHGTPARGFDGEAIEKASEWDLAAFGCFMQFLARKSGIGSQCLEWTDHHTAILAELAYTTRWNGMLGGEYVRNIPTDRIKSLLSDDASGGSYANPDVWDMLVIQPALLQGELLPFVSITNLGRGAQVAGLSMSIPTVSWDSTEGTAADLFSCAGLIGTMSTKIGTVSQFLEVGNDLIADSPYSIGSLIMDGLSNRLQAELDKVIAIGNGTTEPQGIFTGSVTAAPTSTTSAGALTVGDAESLIFSVPKQYRVAQFRPRFLGSDVMYRKFRKIPTATGFSTRAFDWSLQNSQSYTIFEYPYSVAQDAALGSVAFAAMAFYRLWRRLGMEFNWSSVGKTLTLSNTSLISMRARFGGKFVLGEAASRMTGIAMHDD